MIDVNERRLIFGKAILDTVEQYFGRGEAVAMLEAPLNFDLEGLHLVLSAMLADGDAGYSVWLAGREFCAALLDNIPDANSYEVCGLLREAIEHNTSLYDDKGELGREFLTQGYQEHMKDADTLVLSS